MHTNHVFLGPWRQWSEALGGGISPDLIIGTTSGGLEAEIAARPMPGCCTALCHLDRLSALQDADCRCDAQVRQVTPRGPQGSSLGAVFLPRGRPLSVPRFQEQMFTVDGPRKTTTAKASRWINTRPCFLVAGLFASTAPRSPTYSLSRSFALADS